MGYASRSHRRDWRRLMLSSALAGLMVAGARPAWSHDGAATEPALIQQLLDDDQAVEGERRARAALGSESLRSERDDAIVADLQRLLGDALYLQRRYAEAEPHFREALALRRAILGDANADTAVSVSDLANTLQAQGRLAEAEPVYREALAIRRAVLGEANALTATTSRSLARTIRELGRTTEAAAALVDAAELTERAHGANARETIRARLDLAIFLHTSGAEATAETHYRDLLRRAEAHPGDDHLTLAIIQGSLGNLLRESGRPAEAEPHLRRAVQARVAAHGETDQLVARALEDLGRALELQNRPAEALEAYEHGLAVREMTGDTNSRTVAGVLARSGSVLMALSRPAEAEEHFRRMLAIHTKLDGDDSASVALAVRWLANAARDQNRNVDAEVLMRRALDISERTEGPDSAMTAFDLISLGMHFTAQRRFDEAGPLLERAHTIMAGQPAPTSGLTAARSALSHFRSLTGDFDGAASLLRSALEEVMANPLHTPSEEANARLLLAQALERAGDRSGAFELATAAEAVYASVAPDSAARYSALGLLGDLAMSDGRYDDALATYLRIQAGPAVLYGDDGRRSEVILFDIGRARLALGQTDEAIAALERAVSRIEMLASIDLEAAFTNRTGRIEDEALNKATTYDLLVTAYHRLAASGNDDRSALDRAFHLAQRVIESQAAEALAQMAGRQASGDGRLADLIRERQDLAALWRERDGQLSPLLAVPPAERDGDTFARLSRERDAADARIRAIDDEVQSDFPDYAALHKAVPLDVAAVQAALADDQVLLFYADSSGSRGTMAASYLWAVPRSGEPRWVKLERRPGELAYAVDYMRSLMGVGSQTRGAAALAGRPTEDRVDEILRIAHAVHGAVLAPVADMIAGKDLVIVPSRSLSALPFHLLVADKPTSDGDRYRDADWAVRHHAMTMLPSVAALAALAPSAKATPDDRRPYLGFANPLLVGRDGKDRRAFARQACDDPEAILAGGEATATTDLVALYPDGDADVGMVRRLEPLPETADEACAIAATLGSSPDSVLLGGEASEAAVRRLSDAGQLADARILHFATHALVTGEIAGLAEPAIVLSPPEAAGSGDDGLLTASEVATLKVAADWVILSACNTAAGDGGGGEALSGLARAFFYAGARSLMVSHWPVNSDAAVRLASEAVGAYAGGAADKAEALRRAMVAEIERGGRHADPSNWAPFILVGQTG